MFRVLISGMGGDVALGVVKALRQSELHTYLLGMCVSNHSAGLHFVDHAIISPPVSSPKYIDFLIEVLKRFKVDVYFPTIDSEMLLIANNKNLIEEFTGAKVFVGDLKAVEISTDKLKTAEFLREFDHAYPATIAVDDPNVDEFLSSQNFPLIAKSRTGRGSTEVTILRNREEFETVANKSNFILQEFLDPKQGEFTSGFYLGNNGEVLGSCTFKRKLKNGSTVFAKRVIEPLLEEQLENIAKTLGMKYLNIQSMLVGNKLVPFEFNGRLSGTTSMVSRIFNAPEMFIREALLGEELKRVHNVEIFTSIRYFEELYITDNSKGYEILSPSFTGLEDF